MNKVISIFSIVALMFSFAGSAQAQSEALPKIAADYINKHFPDKTVIKTDYNRTENSNRYEAKLSDGTKLDFDPDGNCTEVESQLPIPSSVIPEAIRTYVESKYPGQPIRKWQRDKNNQEVKLMNDLELDFDLDGKFVRVDKS